MLLVLRVSFYFVVFLIFLHKPPIDLFHIFLDLLPRQVTHPIPEEDKEDLLLVNMHAPIPAIIDHYMRASKPSMLSSITT